MRMKKTLAVGVMAAMALALTACGDDGDGDDEAKGGGPKTADIRVWLNGPDTPQDARDWLKKTFEEQNPGSTLTIEEQQWEGLVEKLTTSLSSDSETPDVVEVGNTQAPTFTYGRRVLRPDRRPRRPRRRRPAAGLRRRRDRRRQDVRRARTTPGRSTSSTARTSSRRPASTVPTTTDEFVDSRRSP